MALEINEAFRKNTEQVIIFFYVKSHRAIYGVATVPAPIEMRPSPYSPLIFGIVNTTMILFFLIHCSFGRISASLGTYYACLRSYDFAN